MPMHWLGLLDRARGGVPALSGGSAARTFITTAAMVTIAAQVIFLVNFFSSAWRKTPGATRNPWHATTLEWFLPSPVPADDFGGRQPCIYRSAYMYGERLGGLDFLPQHVSPEQLAKLR
jgi:cytochrome c oxidase subunit 1